MVYLENGSEESGSRELGVVFLVFYRESPDGLELKMVVAVQICALLWKNFKIKTRSPGTIIGEIGGWRLALFVLSTCLMFWPVCLVN